MKYFFFGVALIATTLCFGLDLSYSGSKSSSTTSGKLTLSHKIPDQHRFSIAYGRTTDTTNTLLDPNANSIKLGYGYKFETSGLAIRISGKKTNEFYFYEGSGADIKLSLPIFEIDYDEENSLQTTVSFKMEGLQKSYTKISAEKFNSLGFTLGVEQDILPSVTVGLDTTTYFYSGTGVATTKAFLGQTVLVNDVPSGQSDATTDIPNIINSTAKNVLAPYLEYSGENFSIGTSYSITTAQVNGQATYNSMEIFADYIFADLVTVSISWSRGRSEGSTTNSDSTGFGISWSP